MRGNRIIIAIVLSAALRSGLASQGAAPSGDYVEGRRAAMKLVAAGDAHGALAAFEALAAGTATPFQKSDALEQASQAALRSKDADRALALAKSIPLPAYSKLAQMRILNATQRSAELVKQFGDDDLMQYPDMILGDAAFFRASAWFVVKDGPRAEKDLLLAADYATEGNLRGEIFLHLGATYRTLLKDDARAIAAYRRTYDTPNEFKRSSAAVAVSSILLALGRFAEAKAELERVDERQMTIPAYREAWLKAKQAVETAAREQPAEKES